MPEDQLELHRFAVLLADTLIPGDGPFPSASATGAVEKFEKRLIALRGKHHLAMVKGLVASTEFHSVSAEEQRLEAIAALERDHRPLFEEMLAVLYLSYYESALVTAAIQSLGLTYHNPPQPHGYAMSTFNSADPLEAPQHGRGHYVPTDRVQRVSFAGLDHLATPTARP